MFERFDLALTRQAPSLEGYRREWVPGAAALGGVWVGAIVRDESGQDYWGVRSLVNPVAVF